MGNPEIKIHIDLREERNLVTLVSLELDFFSAIDSLRVMQVFIFSPSGTANPIPEGPIKTIVHANIMMMFDVIVEITSSAIMSSNGENSSGEAKHLSGQRMHGSDGKHTTVTHGTLQQTFKGMDSILSEGGGIFSELMMDAVDIFPEIEGLSHMQQTMSPVEPSIKPEHVGDQILAEFPHTVRMIVIVAIEGQQGINIVHPEDSVENTDDDGLNTQHHLLAQTL
mmetsp:Transcript_6520/g.7302  ORF Transcript_6520/g.7302 Transcript_6520/m.7302 type:complete len:224 (-) Transcript_6520:13-684(-)